MFKLDGEVRLIDSYNNNMREAACTITSKHLQHLEIPIGPPDVDLPGQDQVSVFGLFALPFVSLSPSFSVACTQSPTATTTPGCEQWRAEISVNVLPGDGTAPFEGYAHDTLQGAYDDVEDFQVRAALSCVPGDTRS